MKVHKQYAKLEYNCHQNVWLDQDFDPSLLNQ